MWGATHLPTLKAKGGCILVLGRRPSHFGFLSPRSVVIGSPSTDVGTKTG